MRSNNSNLYAAKKAKNDEFYTQYSDIEKEMNSYIEYNRDVFRDKTVLLPCDDPEWSNFTKYFAANFERLGLKKLISTSYAKSPNSRQISLFEENSEEFDPEKHETHGRIFILDKDIGNDGKIDHNDIQWHYLEGDGDFRSDEVTRLRDESDVIVTNPPFSLFRDFIKWIQPEKRKFTVIGNMDAITYKEVFPLIKDNIIWLGTSNPKNFRQPDGTAKAFGNICWYTNLEYGLRHQEIKFITMQDNLKYNKKLRKILIEKYGQKNNLHYLKYDNYDAIDVPIVEAIPSDYDGVMGVPITFLSKYNPEEFEIVSFRKGNDGKDLVFTREREREYNRTFESLCDVNPGNDKECRRKDKWENYLRTHYDSEKMPEPIDCFHPLSTNLANGLINDCTIDGKKTYIRMLIRRKR